MLSLSDIQKANARISDFIYQTPVLTSENINNISSAKIFFKCENFQKTGSFKMRGAVNAVLTLTEKEKEKGVCTHSSGNFAQALALSAKISQTKAFIVMPESAPDVKKNAVKSYGAEIIFCKPTVEDREKTVVKIQKKTGAAFIHPYNNYNVISGHSSIVFELQKQITPVDFIISPVGGGGLISGIALATHHLFPETKVIGAEPQNASDAFFSLKKGKIQPSLNPHTIADGLLTSLGDKTFPIIKKHVKEIILVSEKEIISAMKLIWERMKIIVEPSSCVTLAAVLKEKEKFRNKSVGIILSGGNVDFNKLPFGKI